MHRHLVALAGLSVVFVTFACGGSGPSDNKAYAPTVVPIGHAKLKGAQLSTDDVVQPTFAAQYPAVVATVNGQQVSGHDLAAREVAMELGRRQWVQATPEDFPKGYVQSQIDDAAADPLELEIDDALERSAAERLGLTPSDQVAEDAAKKYDQYLQTFLENSAVSAQDKAKFVHAATIQGQLDPNWWSQPKWVEYFRNATGIKALRDRYCAPRATPTGPLNYLSTTTARDCTAFLAKERKNAKIVYYVRWVD